MLPTEITDLIARGATFVINHSGGKDSQAMTIFLRQIVPAEQLVVIHAELPGVDWEGIKEHIATTTGDMPIHYCTAVSTFWSLPTAILTGTGAAAGLALVNSVGNLGGLAGPSIVGMIKQASGSFTAALLFLAAVVALGGIIALLFGQAARARRHTPRTIRRAGAG